MYLNFKKDKYRLNGIQTFLNFPLTSTICFIKYTFVVYRSSERSLAIEFGHSHTHPQAFSPF